MPLPSQNALKTQIILLLTGRPVMRAAQVHAALDAECSLQAVYKELRGLMAEGIVRKIGRDYALNASWVLQMQAFTHRLAAACFSETAGVPIATHRKKQVWKFDNMLDMNDFWSHLDLYLVRHAENKAMLGWNPYLWFHLFQSSLEDRFMKSMRIAGGKMHIIIGSDCALNRRLKGLFDRNKVVSSFGPGPFRGEMDTYYNVIGTHLITVRLGARTAQRVESLFLGGGAPDVSEMARLFMRDGKCTLILENNPGKAEAMRRKFSAYFGLPFA